MAIKLASAGAKLVLSATRTSKLEEVKAKCLLANAALAKKDVMIVTMDITDIAAHSTNLALITKVFGRVDMLINNAGIMEVGLFTELDPESDDKLFHVNVISPVRLARTVAHYWLSNGLKGHLAFTSSVAGKMSIPTTSIYGSTKFALQGLANSIRAELFSKNILVTTVCPGATTSELFQVNRNTNEPIKCGQLFPSMTAERCADLYIVALANGLSESWPSRHPFLLAVYFGTLFPTALGYLMSRYLTVPKLRKFLDGKMPI